MVFVIVGISEKLMPFHPEWNRNFSSSELIKDASTTLVVLPIVLLGCQLFWEKLFPQWAIWPNDLPIPVQLVLAVAIAELFFYWAHRLGHEKAFLWQFHYEHHSVRRVYSLNSGRLHVVDAVIDFLSYFFPILFLGINSTVFNLFLTLTLTTGILEHANVNYRVGFLNYLFNTAELHRWHHSVNPAISQKNYGKISSIWDIVFGTFYLPSDMTGIEKVGVEDDDYSIAPSRNDAEISNLKTLNAAPIVATTPIPHTTKSMTGKSEKDVSIL